MKSIASQPPALASRLYGRTFSRGLPHSEGQKRHARVQKAIKARKQSRAKMRAAFKHGDFEEAVATHLASQAVAIVAVVQAAAKSGSQRVMSLEQAIEMGLAIDMAEPSTVENQLRLVKRGGKRRPIWDCHVEVRARQLIVCDVINATFAPAPWQTQFQKGGMQAWLRALPATVVTRPFIAHLDIADCFPSFEASALKDALPLPPAVVENIVMAAGYRKGGEEQGNDCSYTDMTSLARLGLPQGSHHAPLVAADTLSQLDVPMTADVSVANVVDDFVVTASSEHALEAATSKLIEEVSCTPGGNFQLRHKGGPVDVRTATIDILGHRTEPAGDGIVLAPSEANLHRLYGELACLLIRINDLSTDGVTPEVRRLADKFYGYARGWFAAFDACDDLSGPWKYFVETARQLPGWLAWDQHGKAKYGDVHPTDLSIHAGMSSIVI